MRADNIAALGRIGKIAASSIASSGRIGRNVLILIIPVEYTPFTLAHILPREYEAEVLAREFFVEIVENELHEAEVVAGYVYVLALDRPVSVETLFGASTVHVAPPEESKVEVLTKEFTVEVADGGLYD